ncbi:NUDIX hydrolase, partial [Chloroflexota bacterium]
KTSLSKERNEIIWETVERTNVYGGGAVMIVGLTNSGDLILERNWRAAIETYVIQFPGGLTDKQDESEEETAHREFFEETGYVAKKLIHILCVPGSPVYSSIHATYYFAPEVTYVGNEKKDIAEEIEVITVPKNNLYKFLTNLPDETKLDLRVPGIIWILEGRGLL